MRIGLFTDTYLPDINGVVSSTATLRKALEKAGHTVYVITNHAGSKIEFEDRVLRMPGIPLKGLYGYKMSAPVSMRATTYIRNMNLDIIHLQTNFGVGIYGQSLAKSLGIPLVDTYHTMFEDYTHYINPLKLNGVDKVSKEAIRALTRQVCNHVQAVVAPSLKTKEVLQEYGVKAPIYIVPTGLDLEQFSSAASHTQAVASIRAQISEDPQDLIIVFVGRLAREKSLEMPISAFAEMKDPHIHLAIVGDGTDRDYYEDLARDLGCLDVVHFLGKAAPGEIADYYAAFDAFVSASLSETQGMTYLEAMAAGKMVFGRRDEVVVDLIDEGETGYYFDTEKELIEKIYQFKELSDQQRVQKAQSCKDKISPYTDTMFAHKMAAVYDQAILDYSRTYEVQKIKIGGDFVSLTLTRDSEKEPVKLIIPLENYFELKISPDTKLDDYMVSSFLKNQKYYEAWRACKKKIFSRDYTKAQILHYLKNTHEIEDPYAGDMVKELEERNLLDDRKYANDKAQYWQSMRYSMKQIEQKLYKDGIDPEIVREAVDSLQWDLEEFNARETAKRIVKNIKQKSGSLKKQTIVSKLVSKGYDLETARKASEEVPEDPEDEKQALENCYQKACRLYQREEDAIRKQKVFSYCIKHGFQYSDIHALWERDEIND